MQTLTPEQYKAKYGDKAAWSSVAISSRPTIADAIANSFKGGVDQVKQGAAQIGRGGSNPLSAVGNLVEGVGKVGSGAINAAFSPLAPAMQSVLNEKTLLGAGGQALTNNATVQKFANSTAGKVTGRIAENVANYANIAGTVGGAMEVPKAGGAIKTGVENVASNVVNKVEDVIQPKGTSALHLPNENIYAKITPEQQAFLKNEIANIPFGKGDQPHLTPLTKLESTQTPAQPLTRVSLDELKAASPNAKAALDKFDQQAAAQSLLKDVTPSYSKKLIGERGITNADGSITPRVQEGGLIKGRTVTPKPLEVEAAAEVAKVPNYPFKGTALEKYQAIQPEIASRGQALTTSLKNENILRPPQQISKVISDAINKVPQDSLLLQKSDPVIASYMRVANNAIAKADGTLAGELKVRQLLDAAYKNARGKMAFGSDRISALDDIHTAARDALNKDLIAKAQSTDVKASLKSQWDLMRASDVLRDKAEAEAQSGVGRFAQQNPITTKIIKGAGRAAGIGMGVHVIP